MADLHLPIRVNGDLALFQALGSLLVAGERLDHGTSSTDFISAHRGFDAWASHVAAARLGRGRPSHRADPRADRPSWHGCSPTRRHRLLLGHGTHPAPQLGGDDPGGRQPRLCCRATSASPAPGLCPVRGHSNVQGDRTMGIWERPPDALPGRAAATSSASSRPASTATTPSTRSRALRDGKAHVFIGLGGNFVPAAPDTDVTRGRDASAPLTVQISTKLNRSHLVCGRTALILPTLGRTEKDVPGRRRAVRHGRGLDVRRCMPPAGR